MKQFVRNEKGFTLMEMIIVIIVMGILAAVIIPQVGSQAEDAKLSTVKQDLAAMRNAVEVYYAQHNSVYPGGRLVDGSAAVATAAEAAAAFMPQLTQYTDIDGEAQGTKDATHKYGPYIKTGDLPANPFNDSSAVVCNIAIADITTRAWDGTGTAGWHFYVQTGVLVANDSAAHATGL